MTNCFHFLHTVCCTGFFLHHFLFDLCFVWLSTFSFFCGLLLPVLFLSLIMCAVSAVCGFIALFSYAMLVGQKKPSYRRQLSYWLRLKLKIQFYFHQFVDKHAVHMRTKNVSLNLFVKVMAEVQNVFVKSFQSKSGLLALLTIGAKFRRRTRLNGRLVLSNCRLPDQNRIASMWLS